MASLFHLPSDLAWKDLVTMIAKRDIRSTPRLFATCTAGLFRCMPGCPGAASDSTVFQRMEPFQDPKRHFSPGEYLLANSAYGVSLNCIPAYKSPAADLPGNTAFNFHLACSQVRNEHCIGVLKGRWQSLRELRHHIQDDDSMEHICRWVLACAVLHNIMAKINDQWPEEQVDSGENFTPVDVGAQTTITGIAFREVSKKTTLETNQARR